MTPTQFCYWLQGYMEITNRTEALDHDQVETIKNHLNLVFYHSIDPATTPDPEDAKIEQAIHDGETPDGQTLFRC